jgi:hypothetical protein
VRVGQQLGQLRVRAITAKTVEFTTEGFRGNRTESLSLRRDSISTRMP